MSDSLETTRGLYEWNQEIQSNSDRGYTHLHLQLLQIAHRAPQQRGGASLEPSILVHEAYLRPVHLQKIDGRDAPTFLPWLPVSCRRS